MVETPLSKLEIALIRRYQKAQTDLINIIATTQAKGNVTAYRKRLLTSVNQELKLLNDYATGWAKEAIPKAYETGAAQTYAAFRASKMVVSEVALNTKVVNLLTKNAAGMLTDANDFVGRAIKDNIRKASIEAVSEKVATGSTVKQAKANLIKKLSDKGVVAIKDKAGRMIKLDSYASTVARTTTREATNKATMQTVQDAGYDLVKMSQHFSACPLCSQYEGRVYSISGKSNIYPSIDIPFSGDHANIHPNCAHVLTPYNPALDDNAAKMVKESNRDFEVDKRDKKSIEAYNKDQAKKTARRTDRNEWQKAKLAAPKETPKTFSAFRSMKKANGKGYQAIKSVTQAKAIKKITPTKQVTKGNWGNVAYTDELKQFDSTMAALQKQYNIEGLEHGDWLLLQQKSWDRAFKSNVDDFMKANSKHSLAYAEKRVMEKMTPRATKQSSLNGEYFNGKIGINIIYSRKLTITDDIINTEKRIKNNALRIADGKNTRINYTVGESPQTLITHEYGHALAEKIGVYNSPIETIFKKTSHQQIEKQISGYATTNVDEFFAEVFAKSRMPNPPQIVVDVMKEAEILYKNLSRRLY